MRLPKPHTWTGSRPRQSWNVAEQSWGPTPAGRKRRLSVIVMVRTLYEGDRRLAFESAIS